MSDSVARLSAALLGGTGGQVALVHGDLVLAEPAATRLADELAAAFGARVEPHRRPPALGGILADLRTFSLFGGGKVALAIDTAVFADRSAAADLIDDAAEVLPLRAAAAAGAAGSGNAGRKGGGGGSGEGADGAPLGSRERLAAARLLQALSLFEIDAKSAAPPDEVLDRLPPWVFEGGRAARRGRGGRARGKRQLEELKSGLETLLAAARREGIEANIGGELPDLAAMIGDGLPAGHALVFAEREVARDHPLVRRLVERGAVVAVGEVEVDRDGWQGLSLLTAELAQQTGIGISSQAANELARRTLRKSSDRDRGAPGRGADSSVEASSTARWAGEYRKLANLARGAGSGRIELAMVQETVEDRGDEDVWKLLDAVGAGKTGEVMDRLQRLLTGADDPQAARLSFFALLANFCRRLAAIRGIMSLSKVTPGEVNYQRFSTRLAPALQGALPDGQKNPLAGLHAFPLHRAYLAAGRLAPAVAARLPWDVLETELQLKGESSQADAALARLVAHLTSAIAGPQGRS